MKGITSMDIKKLWDSLPKDFKENLSNGIKGNVEEYFKGNKEKGIARLPVVFVLDQSGSMAGNKIKQINDGLQLIKNCLSRKETLGNAHGQLDSKFEEDINLERLDLAVVTFDSNVNILRDFLPLTEFTVPRLFANGTTKMGEAILRSVDIVNNQKESYETTGIPFYRPWIFLVTDGVPTDMEIGDFKWKKIKQQLNLGEQSGDFLFFAVGIEGAKMSLLNELSMQERPALKLRKDSYQNMFLWLINSFNKIIESNPGEKVHLEDPTGPKGWGDIEV